MARPSRVRGEKALYWVASARTDLMEFPERVKDEIGLALSVAQFGGRHPSAKPWKGEGGGVFEVLEDDFGDTYRAVYTVRFEHAIYVLHAFKKKSPSGIRTAKTDIELIRRRLRMAEEDYKVRHEPKGI